ncbi:MAG: hypothetical protein HY551_08390, partial [Elusimicrobia bacterium]|nr:hypothetical protein [Elusimicrobiota bacterium]
MKSVEKRSFVQAVSIVISSALLITAPGLPFYQAAAQLSSPSAAGSAHLVVGGAVRNSALENALGRDFGATQLPVRGLGLLRGPQIAEPAGGRGWISGALDLDRAAFRVLPSRLPSAKPVAALRASAGIVSAISQAARRWTMPSGVLSSPREISRMTFGAASETGARIMDPISGERRIAATGVVSAGPESVLFSEGLTGSDRAGLLRFGISNGGSGEVSIPSPSASRQSVSGPTQTKPSRAKDFLKSLPWMAVGGAVVYALQHFSTLWVPSIFGFVQAAALWGTVSGLPVLGAAVWARHRLSLRDSPRLNGVKRLLSGFMGAYLGTAALIFLKGTGLAAFAGLPLFAWLVPILSGASLWLGKSGFLNKGVGGVLNLGAIYGAFQVSVVAAVAFASAAHPISLGPLVGIMAVAAMMNIAIFLGEIIDSAEKGQAFSKRWLESRRFLAYTWVMIGATFASLSGFSPFWVNYALMLWSFSGTKKVFDIAFFGALGWAAYTGFAAPVAFLVLAFAPERAEMWTRYLLTRIFKKGKGTPSSIGDYQFTPVEKKPAKGKRAHLWLKTGLYFLGFVGYAALAASIIPGWAGSFPKQFLSGLLPVLLSVLAGPWLIQKIFQGQVLEPTTDARAAAVHQVVDRLLKKHQEQNPGKKPLSKAKIIRILKKVMPVPNAFATGAAPRGKGFFRPLIGITEVFEEMIFVPENLWISLSALLAATDVDVKAAQELGAIVEQSKSAGREGVELTRLWQEYQGAAKRFALYRKAIAEVIPGIPEGATPQQVREALDAAYAAPDRDKTFWALGVNVLEGVLSHEINHITHRDM